MPYSMLLKLGSIAKESLLSLGLPVKIKIQIKNKLLFLPIISLTLLATVIYYTPGELLLIMHSDSY